MNGGIKPTTMTMYWDTTGTKSTTKMEGLPPNDGYLDCGGSTIKLTGEAVFQSNVHMMCTCILYTYTICKYDG